MIWANSEQNLSGSKAKYNAHVLYWLKSYKLWQKFKFRKMPRRKHLYFGVSQNGMIWHILAQVFYTCSGVDFSPHLRYAVLTTLGSLNLANIWLKSLNFITYIRFFSPSHNLRESGKWGTFLIASVIFCN